jgi:DNA-binding beta-propeller fold protein YncE
MPRRAWLLAAALAACACGSTATTTPPTPFGHLAVTPAAQAYHPSNGVELPLSVARVSDSVLLLANGADVYRLTRTSAGYSVRALARPAVAAWSPIGLGYRGGMVDVADPAGHDILQLRIAQDRLVLVRRIAGPGLVGPQTLYVEPDGAIVTADEQSGSVLRFGPEGGLRWRRSLASAHGVTESGGFVYATSLNDRAVARFDLAGNPAGTAGSLGGSLGRYEWPVGLAADGADLLVTDSLGGRISVLDRDLRTIRSVGANGPGLDAFDFPSQTLPVTGGYLVVDTFKDRLVRLGRDWSVQEEIALGPAVPVGRQRPWVSVSDGLRYQFGRRPQVALTDGRGRVPLPGVDVAARLGLRPALDFAGAFGGLDHLGPSGSLASLDFGDSQTDYSGLTWAQEVGSLVVVGSPESGSLEVIDPATGMFTSVDVGFDSWWLPGGLLASDGVPRSLDAVIAPAADRFRQARQLLVGGYGRAAAFAMALDGGRPRNWSLDLASAPAQQFLHSPMQAADASRYDAWAVRQSDVRVVELLEVRYLSGT